MYIPKHFKTYELVPEDFYAEHKHKRNKILWIFDDRGLWTIDQLQERYGTAHMNNWYWGGRHQYRGYRPPSCKIGADWSQHRYGRGFDLKFEDVKAEDVRQDILNNSHDPIFEHITCIEMKVSWLHIDFRNWDKMDKGILKVNP